MPLPLYNPSGPYFDWTNYKITTPTFELTPVEKPDMSPFLFHMTGQNELISILTSEGCEDINAECGFLRAEVPSQSGDNYHAPLVCFTESPVFALDFFRYNSFPRWQANQVFGIGFSKSAMVGLNVFPCLYTPEQLKNDIVYLWNQIDSGELETDDRIARLIKAVYELNAPLGELSDKQGFMWEREWRYTNPDGLVFPYSSIEVICCPETEEVAIKTILGTEADRITYVRSWSEYDEVTGFLEAKKAENIALGFDNLTLDELKDKDETIKQIIHSVEKHIELAERFNNLKENWQRRLAELEEKSELVANEIEER